MVCQGYFFPVLLHLFFRTFIRGHVPFYAHRDNPLTPDEPLFCFFLAAFPPPFFSSILLAFLVGLSPSLRDPSHFRRLGDLPPCPTNVTLRACVLFSRPR